MKRSFYSFLLIICLLAQLWVPASADSDMHVSEKGLAFIQELNGNTNNLKAAEAAVNDFIDTYKLNFRQGQFEAMVDLLLAYNDMNMLTKGYKVEKVVAAGNYTDAELASAFTSWVTKDGAVSADRLQRRLREVKLFLYDSYDGNCDAQFRYVIFNANGGKLSDNSVICYPLNSTYSNLPRATRGGYFFAGWFTTASGGEHLYNSSVVRNNLTVYAHWSDTAVDNPNDGTSSYDAPVLKVSERLVEFVKEHEGFSQYAYWDYSQWTIGYGTACQKGEYPNGISREEADYLLRVELKEFEDEVDKILAKGTVKHTQNQYDAIISFTFNLGAQWAKSGNQIYQYILFGGHTEMEFVNTMGAWANAGGSVVQALMHRRMDEADIYLNGNYMRFGKTYYGAELRGNGGTPERRCAYFKAGERLGSLPTATREGYVLRGWYTESNGGTAYTVDTIAPSGTKAWYAIWDKAETVQPTEPQPTEPQPTEPQPTEPQPTEPQPTEPQPTEPQPTEPQPTEPDVPPVGEFTDVSKEDWFYSYVKAAVEMELFKGNGDGTFGPEDAMTREMLVTVLHRLHDGGRPVATKAPFTDVEAGTWYTDAVNWAYANGVVNGVSETEFGVGQNISREQLTTMLYRYAQMEKGTLSVKGDLTSFSDWQSVSEYATEGLRWAVGEGIINGSDGALMPQGNATRAQCAKIMVVFLSLFNQ